MPERVAADEPALKNTYLGGLINEANGLKNVAIIDLRGTDQGEFHDVYRAFAIRARLEQQNGTFANQVIWEGVVAAGRRRQLHDAGSDRDGPLALGRREGHEHQGRCRRRSSTTSPRTSPTSAPTAWAR